MCDFRGLCMYSDSVEAKHKLNPTPDTTLDAIDIVKYIGKFSLVFINF